MDDLQTTNPGFLSDMRNIILEARSNAVRSVEYNRMLMYWHLGERFYVEEQFSQNRAEYGANLTRNAAALLEIEFGSGFSIRQLEQCRQFFRMYPSIDDLRPQLNWSQYRLLIRIDDDYKREYYELESVNNAWTGRETERQINSLLYERLLLSNDKEAVLQ